MSAVVFPIKYAKLGASAKEFLKFVQYDHSTNRLKMAKSLKRGQKIFFRNLVMWVLYQGALRSLMELVHFDVLELRKRPKTVLKQ